MFAQKKLIFFVIRDMHNFIVEKCETAILFSVTPDQGPTFIITLL